VAAGQAISVEDLGHKLLAAIEQHFAQAGAGNALPERRAVMPGEPRGIAWDCEQLSITLVGVGWGQALDASSPSPQTGGQSAVMAVRHAVYAVTLVRCTPPPFEDGSPPDLAELAASGAKYLREAGLLSQALVEFASRLRQGLPRGASVQPGAVEPVGPSGGFHALEATMAITAANLE
jgi:hypothetical protein